MTNPTPAAAIAGAIDCLRECAKMFRLHGCEGHSNMADAHREQLERVQPQADAQSALLEALLVALPYVTDAEGFPEQFKPGVVAGHVRQIRAAIAAVEVKA